ncbi:protein-ADP-ribose hydrolase [uncultured Thomasclavelia sp.]|uniref:protein-ADP-ribose hydrolase n=1 Tax=uncultured Thomasclavelia sp. TaxID=3025759 RepID=UPI0025E1677D|nr:protein-ADP-ribose hydrolase [uncultured Thomasclavelia sp.]
MDQIERLKYLITYLSEEAKIEIDISTNHDDLFNLYRALVNIREAKAIDSEFLKVQDAMLQVENTNKGIVSFEDNDDQLLVWKGDITRLKVDAIVNAANNRMEGCFVPGHHCIDNAIHSYAGIQLRNKCHEIMNKQKYLEPTGKAKITKGYNLPCKYILHTVGPIITGKVSKKDEDLLASCYQSCLRLAEAYGLKTVAFCCISTGVFHFPQKLAAKIAIETVRDYLKNSSIEKVIFNVFKDEDEKIYQSLLKN